MKHPKATALLCALLFGWFDFQTEVNSEVIPQFPEGWIIKIRPIQLLNTLQNFLSPKVIKSPTPLSPWWQKVFEQMAEFQHQQIIQWEIKKGSLQASCPFGKVKLVKRKGQLDCPTHPLKQNNPKIWEKSKKFWVKNYSPSQMGDLINKTFFKIVEIQFEVKPFEGEGSHPLPYLPVVHHLKGTFSEKKMKWNPLSLFFPIEGGKILALGSPMNLTPHQALPLRGVKENLNHPLIEGGDLAEKPLVELGLKGSVFNFWLKKKTFFSQREHCLSHLQPDLIRGIERQNNREKKPLFNLKFYDSQGNSFDYRCKGGGILTLLGYSPRNKPQLNCSHHGSLESPQKFQPLEPSDPQGKGGIFLQVFSTRCLLFWEPEIDPFSTPKMETDYFKEELIPILQNFFKITHKPNPQKIKRGILKWEFFYPNQGSFFAPLFNWLCHEEMKGILHEIKLYNLERFPMMKILFLEKLNLFRNRWYTGCPLGGDLKSEDLIDELELNCTLHGSEIRIPKKSRWNPR